MEIPAAGWVTISSIATLIVTQWFAFRKEKVIHKQQLKKEVFLRKLQAYESNITYNSEGISTFRNIFDSIKRASQSQLQNNNLAEVKTRFNNIAESVTPFLHTIKLYSKINLPEFEKPIEAELKQATEKLFDFQSDIDTLGIEKAQEKLNEALENIETILVKAENTYWRLFKEMQKEISAYL